MKFKKGELEEFEKIYSSLKDDPLVKRMDEIPQHRGSTSYLHSLKVAKLAFLFAKRLPFQCNIPALIKGAILHDYFLYDWRKDRAKLKGHGKNHPAIAVENADRDFGLSEKEKGIILTHMWPINFKRFPLDYESFLVSLADKHISFKEAFTSKRFKKRREKKTEKNIKNL